ncbi:MAG: hypothetical protein WCO71_05510, partial [Pseudomonadota bacterium]
VRLQSQSDLIYRVVAAPPGQIPRFNPTLNLLFLIPIPVLGIYADTRAANCKTLLRYQLLFAR